MHGICIVNSDLLQKFALKVHFDIHHALPMFIGISKKL